MDERGDDQRGADHPRGDGGRDWRGSETSAANTTPAAPVPQNEDARSPSGDDDAARSESPRHLAFAFRGTASEYFGIWIVNIALSLVTLGIYSAWAKVRSRRYLYGNFYLADHSFDYDANPVRILKGRVIMATLLGALALAQRYSAWLYAGTALLVMLLTPWLLVKALAFNARSSSYRGVTFGFEGTTKECFRKYLIAVIAPVVSLGLALPWAQAHFQRYVLDNHRYGAARFHWGGTTRDLVGMYGVGLAITVAALLLGGLAGGIALTVMRSGAEAEGFENPAMAIVGFIYLSLLLPAAYFRAQGVNLGVGKLSLGRHELRAKFRTVDILGLYVTNLLAIVATVGLAIPWAKVRMLRYQASHLELHARGSLDVRAVKASSSPGALGDAALDAGAFDLDFGL